MTHSEGDSQDLVDQGVPPGSYFIAREAEVSVTTFVCG